MFISVIIPVYNGGRPFRQCLQALQKSNYKKWECIVVDDGSTDGSKEFAREQGARVIATPHPKSGPAQARNLGAQAAQGDVLLFIDADVAVHPSTLSHAATTLQANPTVAAIFGSYDDTPLADNFLSQYRNLLHHYVHQQANMDASTFWSGCGAVRRTIFLEMGGFDTAVYKRPSIEDIELGYRMIQAGHHILLDKHLLVQHMKKWTASQIIKTDIFDRAIPWTQLILKAGSVPNDLNLQTSQRLSAVAVWTGLVSLFFIPRQKGFTLLFWLALLILLKLNAGFYTFLQRKKGTAFVLKALAWHWLYFAYSSLVFAGCLFWYKLLGNANPAPTWHKSHSPHPLLDKPASGL
ncbi:MAG: hypothetical protein Kow0080_20620 [Candidatus Promineifilaceae bacterium]